jgi:TonB-dependent SusC/RagA subfamily outer membrane receptor
MEDEMAAAVFFTGGLRLGRTPLAYLALGVVAVAGMTARPLSAQEAGVVAGVVLGARGLGPLANARVSVVGGTQSVVTDGRGQFRLTGLSGAQVTLRVVQIGYRPIEEQVAVGRTDVRFVMSESAIELEAIVVTGTPGETQRRALGNAVVQLDAATSVSESGIQSVGQLLQGRAPGVFVSPSGGSVGKGSRVNIRGITSISLNSDPLIYVDGIRVDNAPITGPNIQGATEINRMNDINPEDIESIEIIKGPAAATLYGTEASNGVIQIITKRGRAGSRLVNLTMRQGAQWFGNPEGRIPAVWARDASGNPVSANLVEIEKAAGRPIWSTGHLQGYSASIRGGTEAARYYLSADIDDDSGIEPTNSMNRFSTRANISLSSSPKYSVEASFGLARSRVNLTGEEGGSSTMWNVQFGNPLTLTTARRGFQVAPPEVLWDAFGNMFQTVNRMTGGVTLKHQPAPWFNHRLTAGLDFTDELNQLIIERMPDAYVPFFGATLARGSKDITNRQLLYTTIDYAAVGDLNVSNNLGLQTSAGLQYYRRYSEFLNANGTEFPAPDLKSVAATAVRLGSDDYVENVTLGVFVQERIAWKNRFFLTGAVRADDNSAFGEAFDLVYYPKVSASWVVNEEPFWKLSFINGLRLRAAYGQTGQQPESFAALRTYRAITGPGDVATVSPRDIGNPNLAPERGKEIELGFDASLFSDRVGIDFTYYNKKTDDVILLRDVAPSSGFPTRQFVNAGSVQNKGIELLVRALPIDTRNADLDLTVSVATNDNKITDLGENTTIPTPSGGHWVGYALGSFFFKKIVGATYNPTTRLVENVVCDGGTGPNNLQPGGAPVACATAPRVYHGRPTPSWEGSVTAGLTLWSRLRLHSMIDFKRGLKKWNIDRWAACSSFRICEVNVSPEKFGPVVLAGHQRAGDAITGSEHTAEDASFTKLREIAATFTVPDRLARRLSLRGASISVAARNLVTWTNWSGSDPEDLVTRDLIGHLWKSQNHLPQLAQVVTTINLTF